AMTGLAVTAQADTPPGDQGPAPAQNADFVLDPAALPEGDHGEDLTAGRFTIAATDGSQVRVTGHERTGAGGYGFTHRLQLPRSGNASARSVHCDVTEASTLEVHALSGSGSDTRTLALYDAADNEVAQISALPDADSDTVVPRGIAEVPAAGSYYLASAGSGINLYRVEVREGELPERAPW